MNANCRYRYAVFLAIALGLAACAKTSVRTPSSLAHAVAKGDAALNPNPRPISLAPCNAAVREICAGLANSDPRGCAFQLKELGVALVLPKIPLPLRGIELSVPPGTAPWEKA